MITQTFTKTEYGRSYSSDARSEDGKVWRWVSNNSVIMVETCREYGIPCDEDAQRAARDAEVSKFLKAYRRQNRNRKPSAEEMYEMRAAFGTGTTVVNVITGRRTRL